MNEPVATKVLIVNEEGQYLAGTATYWEFTEDRSRARVFDYERDRVDDQIQLVRKAHGIVWVAVKLDPSETYEFCDRCGARMSAWNAYFDGHRYFCRVCREQVSS